MGKNNHFLTIIVLALMLTLLLTLAGCGKGGTNDTEAGTETESAADTEAGTLSEAEIEALYDYDFPLDVYLDGQVAFPDRRYIKVNGETVLLDEDILGGVDGDKDLYVVETAAIDGRVTVVIPEGAIVVHWYDASENVKLLADVTYVDIDSYDYCGVDGGDPYLQLFVYEVDEATECITLDLNNSEYPDEHYITAVINIVD